MKKWFMPVSVLGFLVVFLVSGCEWTSSEDDSTWDDSMNWANFSGTYVSGAAAITISNSTPGATNTYTLTPVEGEVLAVGNGTDRTWAGSLENANIYPGSLTITDGREAFEDGDKNNILDGDAGGTGTINYNTGAWSVNFMLQPDAGTDITATYLYIVSDGGSGGSGGGSSGGTGGDGTKKITRIIVFQDGNVVRFVDNDGIEYTGKMGRLTTSGGNSDGTASGPVTGTFEVRGPNGVKIVGTLEGTYTASAADKSGTVSPGTGSLTGRFIRATWIDARGATWNFNMSGGS